MELTFDSGVAIRLPLIQVSQGVEYIPESVKVKLQSRMGTLIYQEEFDVTDQKIIEIPAQEVSTRTPFWYRIEFTSGNYYGFSKGIIEVVPFTPVCVTPFQVRSLIGVNEIELPDTEINVVRQYENLLRSYPDLNNQPEIDDLVCKAEALRLAKTAQVWLKKSEKKDEVSMSRYLINFDDLVSRLETELALELEKVIPSLAGTITINHLQFVQIDDRFSGA